MRIDRTNFQLRSLHGMISPVAEASLVAVVPAQKPQSPLADILDEPWVNSWQWPVDFVVTSIIGCFMGVLAFPFVKFVYDLPLWWLKRTGPAGFPDHASALGFGAGSSTWILICWAIGTCVGLLKAIVGLDAYASFITEVKSQHVEPWKSTKVFVCCGASLCCSVSMGPEAGLGAMGSAIGHVLAHGINRFVSHNPW